MPAAHQAAGHATSAAAPGIRAAAAAAALARAASACPSGDVCVWDGTNYSGSFHGIYGTESNDTGSYDWTHAESVYNNGKSCVATVWTGENFTGTPRSFARRSGLSSLRGTDAWHHLYSNSWGQCT